MIFFANIHGKREKGRSSSSSDISSKLLQLNLTRAVKSCFQIMRLFDQLHYRSRLSSRRKGETLTVIAGEISDLLACLYQFCFCVNAISGAQDIACYQAIDRLKGVVNQCLDSMPNPHATGNQAVSDDKRNATLRERLSSHLFETPLVDIPTTNIDLSHCNTAHSLMVYLCHRLLDQLDQRLMTFRKENLSADRQDLIVPIPVGYLDEEQEQYAIAFGLDLSTTDHTSPFRISELLINGIKAVVSHGYFDPTTESERTRGKHDGLLLYSVDTITLFYVTERFVSIVTGHVGDAIGGNYLNLFIAPAKDVEESSLNHLLIRRLLRWLDFDTFGSNSITVAAIRNIPRYDMESHLILMGKLLCFTSSPKIVTCDEKTLKENVELFLENIV